MKLLVLDNYDSFTYNLVYLVKEIGFLGQIDVVRNDKIALDAVNNYDAILFSPGPGLPKDAGIMPQIISQFGKEKRMLGICLGHQALAESFGGRLYNLDQVYHGRESVINLKEAEIFKGIPNSIKVGRYHSWSVVPSSVPQDFEVIATTAIGDIMGMQHKEFQITGLQFHPESIITEHGAAMIKNWIKN